ncbi:MAG: haloacid dehalogenase type II [Dehalococcoidia bacterium]
MAISIDGSILECGELLQPLRPDAEILLVPPLGGGASEGSPVEALLFDVFGTVVDWRSSIIREGEALEATGVDWGAFADAWRGRYQPSMEEIRTGRRPFVTLDVLHRENLEAVLDEFGVRGLDARAVDDLNRAWHRLDPWPDAVEGIARLRTRHIVAPQSNGNVSLMVDLARHGGLTWDAILGAEVVGHYKPAPESYRGAVRLLDLPPERCMMVAAHPGDLRAAHKATGMRTAYVHRPAEYGPGPERPRPDAGEFDFVAEDLMDLASQLGCP